MTRARTCRSCGDVLVTPAPAQRYCRPDCGGSAYQRWRRKREAQDPAAWRETQRRYKVKASYGLADGEYDLMFVRQGGVCALCWQPEITPNHQKYGGARRLCVDHDHTTGRVRGLICRRCNSAIGYLMDNPEVMERAARYVRGADRPPRT